MSNFTGSGTIVFSGKANSKLISNFIGSGPIVLSGNANSAISYWQFEADGNISLLGNANYFPNFKYVAEGSFGISSDTEIAISYVFEQKVEWSLRSYFEISKKIIWDTGDIETKIFQVQGACRFPTCKDLPIETDDPQCAGALGKNQFIQTVFATSLKGVCDFLIDTGWKWPIASIKKFSQPLSALVLTGNEVASECNELKNIEFCNIPECFEFCLHTDGVTNAGMGFSVVETIFRVESIGKITIFGSYYEPKRFISTGGLSFSGEVDASANSVYLQYTGEGDIIVSGEAEIVLNWYRYTGLGKLTFTGYAGVISPNWHYKGSGKIISSGNAGLFIKNNFRASGTIVLSGIADIPILVTANGKIVLSGISTANLKSVHYISEGGMILSGISQQISPSWHYSGDN